MSKVSPLLLGVGAALATCASIFIARRYLIPLAVDETEESTGGKISKRRVVILYGTTTGTARDFANELARKISRSSTNIPVTKVIDLKDYDEDSLDKEDIVLIICSTWTGGKSPESCLLFFDWLKDYAYDFRVSKDHLSKVTYAAFGLGGEIYDENYCKVIREADEQIRELGATPIEDVTVGDDASDLEHVFNKWCSKIIAFLCKEDSSPIKKVKAKSESNGTPTTLNAEQSKLKKKKKKKETGGKDKHDIKVKGGSFLNQQKGVKALFNKTNKTKAVPPKPIVAAVSTNQETSCCSSNSSKKESSSSCGCGSGIPEDEEEPEDKMNNYFVQLELENDDEDSKPNPSQIIPEDEDSGDDMPTSTDDASTNTTTNNNNKANKNDTSANDSSGDSGFVDLEDIGSKMSQAEKAKLQAQLSNPTGERKEMVTKLQRKALTKEGYRIIGSHSAVKLCRWTKNQMRGRGGCYKHSFYGITSYQCMEATPSLACANKCVFCWRHHKNPVGTEWRWKEDAPDRIVAEAIGLHQEMINEMRGVPGVLPERLKEAFTVKHCALSLVGEPIMYPKINEMIKELHDRQISSFLVTNAQFPEEIAGLDPVTQLYVSVDASTKESLKLVDRPLFKDFWERFLNSLEAMRIKQQRTVYRMTLVKAYNMDEDLLGYVQLIESGMPDFIEIKAVTFCGKSDASSLTMENVPWHKEVCLYGEAICKAIADRGIVNVRYSIATEHEHSCCILLAREDKFKINGEWYTWINYDKFNELITKYYNSEKGSFSFNSADYVAKTPHWALYQSKEKGFDPSEARWRRNKATGSVVEIDYVASESGCG